MEAVLFPNRKVTIKRGSDATANKLWFAFDHNAQHDFTPAIMLPLSAVIQRAVRNTLASQTPALRLLVKSLEITKQIRRASDETLERIQHTGDLALRNCLFEYVCRSPVEIPCGYLKAVQSELFSTTSLALLVARSDLDVESAPRTAYQIVYLIFGILSRDVGGHRLQDTFDLLFDPLLCAADAAYLACRDETASTELQRRRHRKPDEVKTGKFTGARDFLELVDSSGALTLTSASLDPPPLQRSLGPIVSEFCENLAQDLDDFPRDGALLSWRIYDGLPIRVRRADTVFSSIYRSGADPTSHPPAGSKAIPASWRNFSTVASSSPPPSKSQPRCEPRIRAPAPQDLPPNILCVACTNLYPPPLFSLAPELLIINPSYQY